MTPPAAAAAVARGDCSPCHLKPDRRRVRRRPEANLAMPLGERPGNGSVGGGGGGGYSFLVLLTAAICSGGGSHLRWSITAQALCSERRAARSFKLRFGRMQSSTWAR